MILDSTLLSLKAVLAGNVSANQPEIHVDFLVWNIDGATSKPATVRTALNNTTDVTILAAPTRAGEVREPIRINIYNKDTASVTVTIKTDDGTTQRIVTLQVLTTLKTLYWDRFAGWSVF